MGYTEKERMAIDAAYKNGFENLSADDVRLLIDFEIHKATQQLVSDYENQIQELESIITSFDNAKAVNDAVTGFYELAAAKRAKWEAKRKAVNNGQAKQI